jgi:hypothetical protein
MGNLNYNYVNEIDVKVKCFDVVVDRTIKMSLLNNV